jgi:stage III sporulation protein AH
MKRIFKRNQVVLTLLAVMIAAAGYLNYTADNTDAGANATEASGTGTADTELLEISDEDLLQENLAVSTNTQIEDQATGEEDEEDLWTWDYLTENTSEENNLADAEGEASVNEADAIDDTPGTAIFTSSTDILEYVASVQLSREQTRAKNKETLMAIIENDNVDEAQKQSAIDTMVAMTETAEKETAAETLLAAKGYDNAIVYINDDSVDVVINLDTLTDAQRAQVEDIVKRKTEYTVDKIVITLLELGE